MRKRIKVQKYSTSDQETFLIKNYKTAENFFKNRPANFNAVFCSSDTILETDYGFFYGDIELRELQHGVFAQMESFFSI